jgi:serine/threonine protein kinase
MAPASDSDPRLGAVIGGKYRLTKVLGRGAFGAVYEGVNTELEKRVAVKLIEPQYVQHEEVIARFKNEAKAASRVESEHIVQVFDVGTDDEHGLYMVMEMLTGEDLAQRLDRELKLNPTLAVHIAVQACRGLAKAHAAGVVHRDLKPANIFLVTREDGSLMVKLVDFGISKMLEAGKEEGRALTRAGTTVGTPNYMSPEQTRGGEIDGRTDVWALGALLFEMLSGIPAYPHDASYEQTVIAIATEKEPDLASVAPWVPKDLAAVVSKALTRDLDKRIPDCTTFAKLLSEAVPDAARPRREESLYMEPSEPEPVPVKAEISMATAQEIERLAESPEEHDARRAATTVSKKAVSMPPKEPKSSRWPLFAAIAVGLRALAVVFGRDLVRGKQEAEEPEPLPSTSTSASVDPSASASVSAKPVFKPAHPKVPKLKASGTAPKPSASHP